MGLSEDDERASEQATAAVSSTLGLAPVLNDLGPGQFEALTRRMAAAIAWLSSNRAMRDR